MRIFRDIFSGVTLAGVLALVLILVSFAWTNPTDPPPLGSGALTAGTETFNGQPIQKIGISNTTPKYKLDIIAGADNKGFRSTGIAAIMGQLGIGTESPKEKLHISDGNILQNNPKNPELIFKSGLNDLPARGVRVAVSGRYAYATFHNSGQDAFRIIDISNPKKPIVVGGKISGFPTSGCVNAQQIGGGIFGQCGAIDIAVSGKYAYITFAGKLESAFRIVDISNPSLPVVLGGSNLIQNMPVDAGPIAVAVSGRYAYISFSGSGNSAFRVIDVSDPANPKVVGGHSLSFPSLANYGIAVKGNYVYMNLNRNTDAFNVIDVSNPANPSIVGRLDMPLGKTPVDIYISGRYAYVSLFSVSNPGPGVNALSIIDISDPKAPKREAEVSFDDANTPPIAISGAGKYVFLVFSGTGLNPSVLKIIDVSDPKIPIIVAGGLNLLSFTNIGVEAAGHYVYMTFDTTVSDGSFRIADITGIDAVSGSINALEAGSLQVRENAFIKNDLSVEGGLNVGGSILNAASAAIGGELFLQSINNINNRRGGIELFSKNVEILMGSCELTCGSGPTDCVSAFNSSGTNIACNDGGAATCLCAGFGN